ncbi:hypothetical protein JXA88_18400 [Candidatus Fermentibacteria bacterium]|nr:hypothetical protein [Candidatus Fermentibacteria bacterium]
MTLCFMGLRPRGRAVASLSVFCALGFIMAPAPVLAADNAVSEGAAHVKNGPEPVKGTHTLRLEELWRAGDDEDMVFGCIVSATRDAQGNIFLLDAQLSQVQAFSPEGEYLKTLSREGEGPGEIRRADGLLFMPDSTLGAVHFMTGSVVCFDRDNVPGRTIAFGGERTSGGMHSLRSLRNRGGVLVGCAGLLEISDGGTARRTEYLGRFTPEGKEIARYLEHTTENPLGRPSFNEKASYFPSRGGWAVGPDGTVYAAAARDKYEVCVFDPDGKLVRIIEREFSPRKRTHEEKDQVVEGVVMLINGERVRPEATVEDYPPCILDLWVDDRGMLYVRHANSAEAQPDGVMYTLDVFDPKGNYVAEAAIACEGDPTDDELFYLGDDIMVLSRGRRSSWIGMFGGADKEGGSPSSEAVCYRIPPLPW